MIEMILLAGFALCMVTVIVSDILTQKISNNLSILLLIGFAASIPLLGLSAQTLIVTVGIAIVVFAVGFVMFMMGGMGGGDVKIMASSVLWMGPIASGTYINALAFSSVILIATIMAARKWTPVSVSQRVPFVHAWLTNSKSAVPYGVALGIAGIFGIVQTPLFAAAF